MDRKKTRKQLFKIEFEHYIGTLTGLKNQKAMKMVPIREDLGIL